MVTITEHKETLNDNKSAQITTDDGTVIGTITWDTTNQEHALVGFHLSINRKDIFVENKQIYENDIIECLNDFITRTVEINTTEEVSKTE